MSPLRLLAIFAHPDDESFGAGGTLALYAAHGVEVYYVCATRGEAGDVDPKFLHGYATVAALREAELRCAAKELGLAGVDFLGFRDSGMAGAPDNGHSDALVAQAVETVARRIACHIRRLRPQVVITHDPIGGYLHPDHIAVYQAALRAFFLAGEAGYQMPEPPYQPQKLYFYTHPKKLFRLGVRLYKLLGKDPRRFGRNGDIDLLTLTEKGNFPIHAIIRYAEVAERKERASRCHASQFSAGPSSLRLLWWLFDRGGPKDYYTLAYPFPQINLRETDLFAGVIED